MLNLSTGGLQSSAALEEMEERSESCFSIPLLTRRGIQLQIIVVVIPWVETTCPASAAWRPGKCAVHEPKQGVKEWTFCSGTDLHHKPPTQPSYLHPWQVSLDGRMGHGAAAAWMCASSGGRSAELLPGFTSVSATLQDQFTQTRRGGAAFRRRKCPPHSRSSFSCVGTTQVPQKTAEQDNGLLLANANPGEIRNVSLLTDAMR